ncbi:hypothetical protein Cgig2_009500 [Carnegiea gigantea]|uniref:Uncharacterized protein n=1 Tax=Carnegiea gigantea TaxID=171969 RepID=A0A9Q1JWY3_9CARY|nr:hypothetical protein Cgig2_009500 [Carnegiea gigantea]
MPLSFRRFNRKGFLQNVASYLSSKPTQILSYAKTFGTIYGDLKLSKMPLMKSSKRKVKIGGSQNPPREDQAPINNGKFTMETMFGEELVPYPTFIAACLYLYYNITINDTIDVLIRFEPNHPSSFPCPHYHRIFSSPSQVDARTFFLTDLVNFDVNTLAKDLAAHVDELAYFAGKMLDEGGNNISNDMSEDDDFSEAKQEAMEESDDILVDQ